MHKRQVLLLLLLIFTVNLLFAQQVVDRSAKKRPSWVGQVREDYLVTSATAATLEEAQRKCLEAVKIQMLESVAQNIEYSSETLVEQFTHNDDVQSNISFRQRGKTRVVDLPYITGVSLSKATEAYWELVKDKSMNSTSYVYSLLYPYTQSDYQKMKDEFDKLDGSMVSLVKKLQAEKDDIRSVDSLETALLLLERLENYFFDKNRKAEVQLLTEHYEQIYRSLNIESERIEKCKYRCWVTWNGRRIGCSILPKCKSETASQITVVIDEDCFLTTFSDEDCVADDDNYIDLSIRLKHRTLKHRLHF